MAEAEGVKDTFASNLKHYMEIHNLTQSDVAAITGVSRQSVSYWLNAKLMPRMGVIEKIATYFGIKKSDLLENETGKKQSTDSFTTVDDAVDFIMNQPFIKEYLGNKQLEDMTNEEKIEFANDLKNAIEISLELFNRKHAK